MVAWQQFRLRQFWPSRLLKVGESFFYIYSNIFIGLRRRTVLFCIHLNYMLGSDYKDFKCHYLLSYISDEFMSNHSNRSMMTWSNFNCQLRIRLSTYDVNSSNTFNKSYFSTHWCKIQKNIYTIYLFKCFNLSSFIWMCIEVFYHLLYLCLCGYGVLNKACYKFFQELILPVETKILMPFLSFSSSVQKQNHCYMLSTFLW